jgi:hypothetical protein
MKNYIILMGVSISKESLQSNATINNGDKNAINAINAINASKNTDETREECYKIVI